MADYSTIARPYARAVFELALESDSGQLWADRLAALAELVQSPEMADWVNSPLVPPAELGKVLSEALGDLDEAGRNFIRLLAERRRLVALPEIARQFDQLRAEAEGRMTVELRTARPLDDKTRKALTEALGRRLGRQLELNVIEDEELLGGVMLRAGDLVIDGSVKGQLDRLAAAMSH